MKISTFYLNDISDYDSFITKLSDDVYENFYGKGYNSLYISKFISYIRQQLKIYALTNYDKKINVIVNLPRVEKRLIEKTVQNDTDCIKIRLNYEKVKEILLGESKDYTQYLTEIVDLFIEYIQKENSFEFDKYLVIQIDNLVDICVNELLTKNNENEIKEKLINQQGWLQLSRLSAIFNDYYNLYCQDKTIYSNIFCIFLKKIGKRLG
jgi:hypothetical protein